MTSGDKDYIARHPGAPHALDGHIKIDGSSSDWLFGVTPKQAGFDDHDSVGRLIAPVINSTDITLNYA